ncbi:MAG TPA: ABC transporter ATP-binding protein [Bacillota bacterium]|nr:ABC transporter ATP-binding protein [Bacillota bacterium]
MSQSTTKYAVQTKGLGKRYRSFWALKDCTIRVPRGTVTALVGPNGAGKTTLLKLLVSLSRPSTGSAEILGQIPAQKAEYLAGIGYLGQEIPLYNQLSAGEHMKLGAHLNTSWDNELATRRLTELDIDQHRPVGKLSGGQRAQVALALALAKKPKLLLLDEPVAALDPLARVDFLSSLASAVTEAGGELTVVMSSHLLADLERICDHVIILASGQTQLCDSIDAVLKMHKLLTGPRRETVVSPAYTVIRETQTARETTLLVRLNDLKFRDPHWHMHDVDIEEIVLAYMSQSRRIPGVAKAERSVQ